MAFGCGFVNVPMRTLVGVVLFFARFVLEAVVTAGMSAHMISHVCTSVESVVLAFELGPFEFGNLEDSLRSDHVGIGCSVVKVRVWRTLGRIPIRVHGSHIGRLGLNDKAWLDALGRGSARVNGVVAERTVKLGAYAVSANIVGSVFR